MAALPAAVRDIAAELPAAASGVAGDRVAGAALYARQPADVHADLSGQCRLQPLVPRYHVGRYRVRVELDRRDGRRYVRVPGAGNRLPIAAGAGDRVLCAGAHTLAASPRNRLK